MTATILDAGLDTDSIDLLDFDYAPPCDATDENDVPCPRVAVFLLVKKCCGTKFLACEECFFGWKEQINSYDVSTVCNECGHVFAPKEDPLKFVGRIS